MIPLFVPDLVLKALPFVQQVFVGLHLLSSSPGDGRLHSIMYLPLPSSVVLVLIHSTDHEGLVVIGLFYGSSFGEQVVPNSAVLDRYTFIIGRVFMLLPTISRFIIIRTQQM